MLVDIFKTAADLNVWSSTRAAYSFERAHPDEAPFAVIDVPPGWMLVGEPPMLIKRLDANVMTNRDATEALTSALMGAEGFAIHQPPAGGMPMLWAQAQGGDTTAEAVVMAVAGQKLVPPADTGRALPAPSRNGKADLPAVPRRRR